VIRRALVALCALALSTPLLAAPAQAADNCKVSVPSKISITSPYKEVTVKFSGSCTSDGWAAWDVVHPTQGLVNMLLFDSDSYLNSSTSQKMAVYDWDPRGTWNVRPEGAWRNSTFDELQQNTISTKVKVGTRVSLSSSRSGSYVTLVAKPTYYSPSASAFRASKSTTVSFYSQRSDGTWKLRKTAASNSKGVATVKISAGTTQRWKATVAEGSGRWGATSKVVSR
jgi:hypothetical protein